MQNREGTSKSYRAVGIVGSLSLHALLLGVMGLSCMTKKPPEPPPFKQVELLDVIPVGPLGPQEPPAGPQPQTPAPEPPKPKDPEPPKPKDPEPPKPKEPEPKKPKEPEPKKPKEPKKSSSKEREDEIKRRLQDAKKNPPPQNPPPQNPRSNADELSKRLDQAANNVGRAVITHPSGNHNPNLTGAQLSASEAYISNVVFAVMQPIWNSVGPNNLSAPPRAAQVTLVISPQGKILSIVLSQKSDSARMNDSAQKLIQRMQGMQLRPFSATGLNVNTSLTFTVTLEYKTGNSR